jgi:hypothetical protein
MSGIFSRTLGSGDMCSQFKHAGEGDREVEGEREGRK